MSKTLSRSYFQKQYMQRVAAGELFIPEPESPAVDMFVAELNKSPMGDADFSVYKFDDIEWGDFLCDIFSSEEYRDHTKTGFEYRAIVEDACAQSLRTFIGKIKKVDTKLALLKFFMSDDFHQNVLSKGYCAYRSSADMIQLQCAKLMGEINRSLHGEVAPDLADIVDELAEDAGDKPVNSEQDIKKIIASLPTKKMVVNGKVMEIYQLPKDEEITPIGKLIASVNKGEVQARKADWKHLVQEGFRAEQTTPMTFMYWMQEYLTNIKVRDYRVDALHTIIENLPAYLQEVEASDDVQIRYKQDCKNLMHYFRQIIYIIRYFDEAGRYWNEHRDDDQLDVETYLYFRFLDRIDDLKEYLAFSQAHYIAICANTGRFIPNIVAAQSEPYWNTLVTENIISFCRSLYMAETTRLKYLAGWKKPFPALTIDTFDRKLRNRCFDLYIERRTKDICTELNKENRRSHDATPKECLIKLLETDTQEYQRLKTIGNLPGSIVYDQEWKAGTPDILAMTEFFLQYLSELIKGISDDSTTPSVEPQLASSTPAIPSVNLNLPLGVIYYLWDPRTPAKNKFIADNARTIMSQLWEIVLVKCPEVKPLGGFKLHIVYQHLSVDALMLNHIAAYEWSRIDYSDYPSFVFRCPHVQQAKLIGSNHKEKPIVGLTKIIYHSNFDCTDLSYYVQVLSGAIFHAFRNMIGLTTDYLCSSYPDLSLSLPEKKQNLLADMWEGELILHQLDDRDISEFDSVLADYDGVGTNADDFDSALLPYSNGTYSHKDPEPPIDQTQNKLFQQIRDYAEKQIHQKQDYTLTELRQEFIRLYTDADEAYMGRDVRTAIATRSVSTAHKSQQVTPSADWTLINLWQMDPAEITDIYQDDFSRFSTIMSGYLQQGTTLEDILKYLLRFDGKFLHLPRHSNGKSKGRLNQTAIRKGMENAGFPFKKSNYSKILQGK